MSLTRVILPKLGLTMDEGRVVAWHRAPGDLVREGDVLFEVETDKATLEVPSPVAGVLRRILVPMDAVAPVATVVALITTSPDEPIDEPAAVPAAPSPPPAARPAGPGTPAGGAATSFATSPAARKLAAALGVDLAAVRPASGTRITTEDVEAAANATPRQTAGERRVPLTRMRRAIAEAMTRSSREAPQFSIERDVDLGGTDAARQAVGASYTDIVVAAVAKALAGHPRLRARFDGDAIVERDGVHVGLAVALDDGLIVPVIRDADRKDLGALARERQRLEQGARAGRLAADDLSGAVISVSNLGPLGVDRFTAIVNPPEAVILAMGRVRDRVVVRDGTPAVRPTVTLTLSVDHRVADGADAARFLADVAKHLEGRG